MIKSFLDTLKANLDARRPETITVIAGLIVGVLIAWWLLAAFLNSSIFGLFLALIAVVYGSTRLKRLEWFWGEAIAKTNAPKAAAPMKTEISNIPEQFRDDVPNVQSEEPTPAEAIDQGPAAAPEADTSPELADDPLILGCVVPRETPQGTRLDELTNLRARMRIKSAIRFWNWFLPGFFTALAIVIGLPFGAIIGATANDTGYRGWSPSMTDVALGSLFGFTAFMGLALWSYYGTRPWVRVIVTPETIRYGEEKYDRRYFYGVRAGYKSNEAEIKSSFTAPSLGVQAISLGYGQWSQDLKYMVDAYHAAEIVVWMNDVISSVGAPPPTKYDAYAGRKPELL